MQEGQGVVDRERLLEQSHRLGEVALVALDLGQLGEGADRVGVDLEGLFDQVLGGAELSFGAMDGAQVEQRVGVGGVEGEGGLELLAGLGEVAVAEVDLAEVVVNLGGGLTAPGAFGGGARRLARIGGRGVAEVAQGAQGSEVLLALLRAVALVPGGLLAAARRSRRW